MSCWTIPIDGKLNNAPIDPKAMTAIQLVNGYNGFGVHTFLTDHPQLSRPL